MTNDEKVLEGKWERGEHQENTRRAMIVYNQTWFMIMMPPVSLIHAQARDPKLESSMYEREARKGDCAR